MHIPFDELVGASESCLGGDAGVTLERQIPGKVTFRIRQSELGDLGEVEITKIGAEYSQVYFKESTALPEEEGIAYALRAHRLEFSDDWAQFFMMWCEGARDLFPGLRGNNWRAKVAEFHAQKSRAVKFLADARKERWGQIIQTYFWFLGGYAIWLSPPDFLPNARLAYGVKQAGAPPSSETQPEPPGKPTLKKRALKGGRPRNSDDEWAREQVQVLGRPKLEVFQEWKTRIGERAKVLADPQESFDKAVGKKPKKGD